MTDVSVSLLAKRKRGRPRKDGNPSRVGSLENPNLMKTQHFEVKSPTQDEINKNSKDSGAVDGLVGSMIYGVIEGSFDAGYLISVRIGNNDTPFRGVVFQPRKFVPITAANDVAPQAKMYQRREIPIPAYDDFSQISPDKTALQSFQVSKQAVLRPISLSIPSGSAAPYSLTNNSACMPPEAFLLRTSPSSNAGEKITVPKSPNKQIGSLRMVEQDEVMQAFEVSTSSKGPNNNSEFSFKVTANSSHGIESINPNPPLIHGHGVELGCGLGQKGVTNVELHRNFMEDITRSAFEIQQGEMIEHQREFVRLQNSPSELQEIPVVAQVQSFPRETQPMKTEMQPTDVYCNELRSPDVNFHQNLFSNQSHSNPLEPKNLEAKFHPDDFLDSVPKSPNLKLDLASSVHSKKLQQPEPQANPKTNYLVLNELKNQNLGFHQALVSGNPLLLPPDLIGEPMEFMLETPKSPPNSSKNPQETNSGSSPSAPYNLELATPQPTPNTGPGKQTGCISDMDFVLSDVVQPAESHGHQSDHSGTEHR